MALRTPLSVTPHLYMGDSTGRPLDMGTVYFGEQDKDPEFYPINLFSDDALTLPLAQPVHTKGGYLYDKGDMVEPHAKELIYSVKVLDSYGRKVFYKGAMMRNSWNDDVIQQINEAVIGSADVARQIATDITNDAINNTAIEGGVLADTLVVATANGVGSVPRTQRDKNSDTVSVKDFGAVGDGKVDDTAAIQAAFDSEGLQPIFFPEGLYKITGQGEACLTLSKNRNLVGCNRAATIRVDGSGLQTSAIRIKITDNKGFLDVRNWQMVGINLFHNGGGGHGLHIEGGMTLLNAKIDNCSIGKGSSPDAYGIYVYSQLAHSEITNSGVANFYMKCGDANIIRHCLTFGTGVSVTFDCVTGVRNNTVQDCTLVNRDGQVKIINGDNIRILNNQMELAQGLTPSQNQSNPASMIHLVGVDRPIINTVIEDNNFGGGTNLDYSIYADNAQRTVIDKNNFIAVNINDIHFSERSSNNLLGSKNTVKGSSINPRTGNLFKLKTADLGTGNMGTLQKGSGLSTSNGWSAGDFYKNSDGVLTFIGEFNNGSLVTGSAICTLPKGFHPYFQPDSIRRNTLSYTEDFDNTYWLKTGTVVTVNSATAPDGNLTADTITATATDGKHSLLSSVSVLPSDSFSSFSVYLKKVNSSSIGTVRVEVISSNTIDYVRATINLDDGTAVVVGNTDSIEAATIAVEPSINGFYRVTCSFKVKAGKGGNYYLSLLPNNTGSTHGAYLANPDINRVVAWGAQLETGNTSTPYQRVRGTTDIKTVFQNKTVLATTDDGVGTVVISSQGGVKVGSLPSNKNVSLSPFQCSSTED